MSLPMEWMIGGGIFFVFFIAWLLGSDTRKKGSGGFWGGLADAVDDIDLGGFGGDGGDGGDD